MRKWLILNVKFDKNGHAQCAKSYKYCTGCPNRKDCEEVKCYYDPYDDIGFCRENDYRKR